MDNYFGHHPVAMESLRTPLQERIINAVTAAMQANPDISTQPKLAKRSGVAQSHISRLLKGQNISVDVLEKVAKAIGKQPFELIIGEEDKTAIMARIFGPQPLPERANKPFGDELEFPPTLKALPNKKHEQR